MSVPVAQHRPEHGSLPTAISNAVVSLVREYTGRGPTRARTTIRDNVVLVMLEDTLTRGELALARNGRESKVMEIRREFQDVMRAESSARVAQLTGRDVVAMMSANHVAPDLGAELFVLDSAPSRNGDGAAGNGVPAP